MSVLILMESIYRPLRRTCMSGLRACRVDRFVKNQLAVEITANATTARLLGWIIKQHSIIAFALYTAGGCGYTVVLLWLPDGNPHYHLDHPCNPLQMHMQALLRLC